MKTFSIYILASRKNGTLYIGMTSDLARRVQDHRSGVVEGFTKKYGVHTLVYVEQTTDLYAAMQRENRLKKWNRAWKIALIEKDNPGWNDISYKISPV